MILELLFNAKFSPVNRLKMRKMKGNSKQNTLNSLHFKQLVALKIHCWVLK